MAEHQVTVYWERGGQVFTDNRYRRAHIWKFDGGVEVTASSSPSVVPLPYSSADAVDPEEAFVAALSSCHMLWFLSVAATQGYCVDSYTDNATGLLGTDETGRLAMTRVTLHPAIVFSGAKKPTGAEIAALHHEAHEQCFLARSVKTDIRCEPVAPEAANEL